MDDAVISIEFGDEFLSFYNLVRHCTMVSVERAYATYKACKYVCQNGIEGDFVECGVYRGGMAMLAALTFSRYGAQHRNIWLFDTFSGMTTPTEIDRSRHGENAADELLADPEMCVASFAEVRKNLASVAYPAERLRFVEGDVLRTLRDQANLPKSLAIIRLDTDWYESTRLELEVLYPRLCSRGVVLVDDYGHWLGARKAIDEFLAASAIPIYLGRTDTTGVEFVKPSVSCAALLRMVFRSVPVALHRLRARK